MVTLWKTSPMAILKIGWAKYGQFSNRCWKIGPFSNRCLKIRSIFKHILKKYPSPGRGSALGAPPEAAPGVFFLNLFENGPYFQTCVWKWTIFRSSYFKIAIGLVFQNFNLLGDASHHHCCCVTSMKLCYTRLLIPGLNARDSIRHEWERNACAYRVPSDQGLPSGNVGDTFAFRNFANLFSWPGVGGWHGLANFRADWNHLCSHICYRIWVGE